MTVLTPEQLKGRIKSISISEGGDARALIRLYMMERFLVRLSESKYRDNFVIKGGYLITSLIGMNLRSTMDIDSSLQGLNLEETEVLNIMHEIIEIDLNDGVQLSVNSISRIMDKMDYGGIRVNLVGKYGKINTPFKIDLSAGDAITPRALDHKYKLLLEDSYIGLWSYNIETILAEKLETIVSLGEFNTRMRDFYDVYMLVKLYRNKLDIPTLRLAYNNTCKQRGINVDIPVTIYSLVNLKDSSILRKYWERYKIKYSYASDLSFYDVFDSVIKLLKLIK